MTANPFTLTVADALDRISQYEQTGDKHVAQVLRGVINGDLTLDIAATEATVAEIDAIADVSGRVQQLTASGAVTPGVVMVELAHNSTVIAATIADAAAHAGVPFVIENTSASGTAAHTVTLTSGTFDGTNDVATLDAPGERLIVIFNSAGDGIVVQNTGTVGLS